MGDGARSELMDRRHRCADPCHQVGGVDNGEANCSHHATNGARSEVADGGRQERAATHDQGSGTGHSYSGELHCFAEGGQHCARPGDRLTGRDQLSQVRFCLPAFRAVLQMRFKEGPVGQADRAPEEGKEPVPDVVAIHGSSLRRFHGNPNSDHRHCRPACRGAAAGTVNYVAGA